MIQSARKFRHISRTELGKAIGKPYQRIREWELGINIPKYSTVKKIADILAVSVNYFYQDLGELKDIKYYSEINENGDESVVDGISKTNWEFIQSAANESGLEPYAFLNFIIDEYRAHN